MVSWLRRGKGRPGERQLAREQGRVAALAAVSPNMPQCEVEIVRILDGALNSSGDSVTAAAKLAGDLRQFFRLSESERDASELLWKLWMILLEAVRIVPTENPGHAALVGAVKRLRSQGGPVIGLEGCTLQWADLPHLREYIFDKWYGELATELLGTYKRAGTDQIPAKIPRTWTTTLQRRWTRGESSTSFASQLLSDDYMALILLPYWEIRASLETPPPKDAAVFECKLWVATEWLTRCAQLLHKDLGSAPPEGLDEEEQANIAPGPLCAGVYPQSLERWNFWRSRLSEIASAKPSRGEDGAGGDIVKDIDGQPAPSSASLDRIKQAIAVMDAANNGAEGQ
ncbi:hypothetical protein VTK26DRAFT_3466 [Humicola hyalothermophila]